MSTPGVHDIDLTGMTLELGRQLVNEGPTASLVLRAWPAGCTVTGGAITIPDSAIVLLTGGGATFKGTTFMGRGALVCCEDTFSATFIDCTFACTTLYAAHGAAATLRRCTFTTGFPGIVASGAGTCVALHGCTLQACLNAVTAESGAVVLQHRCTSSHSRAAVIAHGASTRVACTESTFSGVAVPGKPASGVGMEVVDAQILLRGCCVEWFMHGIQLSGASAAAELHGSTVRVAAAGLISTDGAAFSLRNSDVHLDKAAPSRRPQRSPDGPACLVTVQSGRDGRCVRRAHIERCRLSALGSQQHGVTVAPGGALVAALTQLTCGSSCVTAMGRGSVAALLHCMLRSDTAVACTAQDPGAVVRVVGGQVAGGQAAGLAIASGTLTARGAVLSGLIGSKVIASSAVAAQEGGTLRLSGCTLRHASKGVELSAATARAHDVAISDLLIADARGGDAGYSLTGGKLTVKGGFVKGCVMGACASSGKGGAHADFDGVSFDGNELALQMCGGATVRASCCVFSGGAPSSRKKPRPDSLAAMIGRVALYVADDAGGASLTSCTFQNHDQDIHFYGQSGIQVSDCSFLGGRGAGCSVMLQGRGSVKNCVFQKVLCGVALYSRGCAVSGCTFGAGLPQGLLADDGAAVAVSECSFDGCKTAIEAKAGASVDVADSTCTDAGTGVEITGAAAVRAHRLTITGGDMAVQVTAGGSGKTSVKMDRCKVSGAAMGAVLLKDAGATATLEGSTVTGCKVGVVLLPGAVAQVVNTNILRCQVGAAVGVSEDMLANACGVCGRSGGAAMARAWAQLSAAGGTGVPGARCMHDGAYALLTMRDVEVRGCAAGVQLHGTGRVDAERVDVRGCMASYSLTRIGAASRFEQCRATDGSAPSVFARRLFGPHSGQFEVEMVPGLAVVNERGPPTPADLAPFMKYAGAMGMGMGFG